MELERFWRWMVVALAAFGVMLVSAGVFGTMLLRPRKQSTATCSEQQLVKTDGAQSSPQSEIGWVEPDEHPENRSASGQLEGGKEPSDNPDKGMDEPEIPKQPEPTNALAEKTSSLHNIPVDSLSNPSPADGNDGMRDVLKEKPSGDTNRTATVKSTPKTGKTSVADSAHGKESRPGGAGEIGPTAPATERISSKNGHLHPDNQPVVGGNEDTEEAAVANPGEIKEVEEED